MKIEKIHLDDIRRCYSASHITIDNKFYALLASEDPNSLCMAYSGKDFSEKEVVWKDRGGCMSIIPIPGKNGEFLAVNEFYLKVSPSLAKIVWGKRTENEWEIKDLFSLPYIHRFDIYNVNGVNYFIGATIAKDKQHKEDWSLPGQIYVAKLPDDLTQEIHLEKIYDDCYRNHGYAQGVYEGKVCGYFASDQGVVRVMPPYDGKWTIEKILDGNISEIAFSDVNNDGQLEMMTIEPFHGNQMKIYKLVNGKYELDYTYPTEIDFAHTLVGTTICGVNSFVGGVRRVEAELFIIQYHNGQYEVTIVEKGVGPANLTVVNFEDEDIIISANHTKDEAAIYRITK